MARQIWHKRFHGDALTGYMGLSLEQRGAYTTLLDLMYDTDWDVGIPDRERWIAGHLNVSSRRWRALREELIAAGKIDIIGGLISNSRYRKERENGLETSRKRAESGASGGAKSGEARRKSSNINDRNEASASSLPLYARATEADTDTEKKKEETLDTSPPTTPREGDDDEGKWDVIRLSNELTRIGGIRNIDPGQIIRNTTSVREWIEAGADPPLLAKVIQTGRDTATNGIGSLKYFDGRVRAAIARRDHPNDNDRPRKDFSDIRDPLLRRYLERGGTLGGYGDG